MKYDRNHSVVIVLLLLQWWNPIILVWMFGGGEIGLAQQRVDDALWRPLRLYRWRRREGTTTALLLKTKSWQSMIHHR